jgi:hypothetical protein
MGRKVTVQIYIKNGGTGIRLKNLKRETLGKKHFFGGIGTNFFHRHTKNLL